MKIEVNREIFSKKLLVISTVVNTGHSLPICQEVLFEVGKENIRISGTNLEISVSTLMPYKLTDGEIVSFVAPISEIMKTIENLKSENVWIRVEKNLCEFGVSESRKKYKVGLSYKAVDYPKISKVENMDNKLVKNDVLPALINAALVADKKLMHLWATGVHIQCLEDKIRIMALTQNIFFMSTFEKTNQNFENIIVPIELFNVLKLLNNVHFSFGVDSKEKTFAITDDNFIVSARTIDSVAPNVDMITNKIPKNENYVKIDKKEILQSLKRVSLYRNTTSNSVKINMIDTEDQTMSLESENIDFGKMASEQFPYIEKKEINHITGLNSNYFATALNGLNGDVIQIDQTDPKVSMRISDETNNFCYYISPVLIN
jgi:DNA polymerase-3 subunit beta